MSACAIRCSARVFSCGKIITFSRPGIQSKKSAKSEDKTTSPCCPFVVSQWYKPEEEPSASPSGLWWVVITIFLGWASKCKLFSPVSINLISVQTYYYFMGCGNFCGHHFLKKC